MTLDKLKNECKKIKGILSIRKARLGDGIFIKYKEIYLETSKTFWTPTDFIHLDTWKDSLARTKMEYERFYL
jgi:hypothetical protein